MNNGKQLGKIESQLKAYTMTDDIENLTKANHLLMDLISEIRHKETKEYASRFATKIQTLFKNYVEGK